MAYVYWIKTPDMDDMFSQGYVGFTSKDVAKRFEAHKQQSKSGSYPIHNAIRKYGENLTIETLVECSDEYGLWLENKLRPEPNIGWNVAVGGTAPMLGRKHSEAAKLKITEAQTGVKASENARRNMSTAQSTRARSEEETARVITRNKLGQSEASREKISQKAKDRYDFPWNWANACQDVWARAEEFYKYIASGGLSSPHSLAKAFGYSSEGSTRVVSKKLKSGWNPSEDPAYLLWLESYKLKEINGT